MSNAAPTPTDVPRSLLRRNLLLVASYLAVLTLIAISYR